MFSFNNVKMSFTEIAGPGEGGGERGGIVHPGQ